MLSNSEAEDNLGMGSDEDVSSSLQREKKSSKKSKDGKKKKSWKGTDDQKEGSDLQQPSAADDKKLKLNVNPTEIENEEEEQQEEKKESSSGEEPKRESAMSGAPQVIPFGLGQQKQRQMDSMLLNSQLKEIKEKMLDYVNEIIVRQNGVDPVANIESFQLENTSRKVSRELLAEFQLLADELKKKQNSNEEKIRAQKALGEKQGLLIKKLSTQCQSVETFNKRMQVVEQKIEQMRDSAEKRHETIKDFVSKMKESLESKVDQITQFNVKINTMTSDLEKMKKVTDDFMYDSQQQIMVNMDRIQKNTDDFTEFKDLQDQKFNRMQAENAAGKISVDKLYLDFEKHKEHVQSKLDQMFFDIDRRVKVNDVKQNFEKLNEMLSVKFKQLEDTKQAMRSLITYQKYFHPIQTQQLISENLMQLKTAKKDEGFIAFQQNLYNDIIEETRKVSNGNRRRKDVDLEEHRAMLEKKMIAKKGDGWNVFAMTNISEGCDFVTELLEKYLEDIRVRHRDEERQDPIKTSVLLRRQVKLQSIDEIIDEISQKTVVLKDEAEAMAFKIAEENRLKDIADNIKKLQKRRLEFQHREAYKRQHSYKGRIRAPIIYGDEKEDFKEQLDALNNRTKSPKIVRKDKLRHVQRERNINFDEGVKKERNESQLSMTMTVGSVQGSQAPTPTQPIHSPGLEVGGMGLGDGEGGGLTERDIKKLFNQFKVDMKPMITDIADRISENKTVVLKRQCDNYQQENDKDKKMMVNKMEAEMLTVSNHLKSKMEKLNADFENQIRNIQRQLQRNKSDTDKVFESHKQQIQEGREDIDKHQTYFDTMAQSIALIAENLNMQMEAEFADLFDRKMMALYGLSTGKPSRVDMATKLSSKVRQKPYRAEANRSPKNNDGDIDQSTYYKPNTKREHSNDEQSDENSDKETNQLDINMAKIGSIRSMQRMKSGDASDLQLFDNIRMTSGKTVPRQEMSITIEQQCLSHQHDTKDIHLTLKMFKMACLAYKPSKISYREQVVERTQMIEMRRALIDRVSNILPDCDLFRNNAIYPKRYFDDLMIDEKGYQEHFSGQISRANFKKEQQSKMSHLYESTNMGSDHQKSGSRLHHSPTHQMPLNTLGSNFKLPDLNPKIASNLNFGIGQRGNYDAASLRNQSMTIEVPEDSVKTGTHFGYMARSQMKGMYSQTSKNNSDIKRNASVAVVNKYYAPKLFNSSRKNFNDPMNSTIEKMDQIGMTSGTRLFVDGISRSPTGPAPIKNLEFHKRNNSTIGQNFGTNKLESDAFGKHRPSAVMPSGVKPKVSFDLPTVR